MNAQLTVRLPQDLDLALTAAAERLQRKRSEVVRMALQRYLEGSMGGKSEKPVDRVRYLIGSLESGITDLAERHREYLMESLQRGQ